MKWHQSQKKKKRKMETAICGNMRRKSVTGRSCERTDVEREVQNQTQKELKVIAKNAMQELASY